MPYVQITWLEGRSTDQKRKIAKRIASALMEEGKASAEHIQITFQDLPTTSYALAGTLVADLKPDIERIRNPRKPRAYDAFKSRRISAASTK